MEVVGIGLANIDLVAHVEEDFLIRHRVPKGFAKKYDDLAFGRLRGDLEQYDAIPGGCVANTLCGLAAGGVPTQFFGKIGADSFESLYRASFQDYTVKYEVEAAQTESSQCAVLVTPDGERSFAYSPGASWDLSEEDIDEAVLAKARLIYAEVYAFEFGAERTTAKKIFETAKNNQVPLAMKVMDTDFGGRYAQHIKALADAGTLTLLIGNHENLPSVEGTRDWREAIETFKLWRCDVLMSANRDGCYFISSGRAEHFPVEPVLNPKNTAGAGDQFVAGFLTGWLDGRPVADCAAHGTMCARVILNHDMARPPLVNKHSISF